MESYPIQEGGEKMSTGENKLCLNVPEVARELGVSKPMAYMLANRVDFPSFRVGKRILGQYRINGAWPDELNLRRMSLAKSEVVATLRRIFCGRQTA